MHQLVLIRHGESTWNLENRFTGWTDVDLTETGVEQAKQAGRLLKAEGYDFDVAYTSVLSAPPARSGTRSTSSTAPGYRWCIPGASTNATTAACRG